MSVSASVGPVSGIDYGKLLTGLNQAQQASIPVQMAAYNRDTPVEKLAADPAAVAVLNKDLPGLLTAPEFSVFKSMSLKQLQQASGGDMSMVDLDKTEADLQALPAH